MKRHVSLALFVLLAVAPLRRSSPEGLARARRPQHQRVRSGRGRGDQVLDFRVGLPCREPTGGQAIGTRATLPTATTRSKAPLRC